uniref:Uncharacterized protein n=1 Tax=Xiphophorus couchianus TaxID=32473 RepID=A0A3B5MCS8_9TELE
HLSDKHNEGIKTLDGTEPGEIGSIPKKKLRQLTFNCPFPAYDRYYNKYINVKKGGIGGVAMFLFGYVAISYLWSYEHLKHDRWRKYH